VTIDHVSGGRLILGLGAGWQENEHAAYGIELPSIKSRLDWLEEACVIVTSLLREPRTTFKGEHYVVTDAPLDPKPVNGTLPFLVGGGGEKRTMRIAARFADEWNVWGDPELLKQKNAVLDRHCEDLGRDPATMKRSANALLFLSEDEKWVTERRGRSVGRPSIIGTPDEVVEIVAAYDDAGVDELIVPDFNLRDPQVKRDTMDLFMERVVAVARAA
jgi:alkanesulfonate monooxygenase SsuD/methylene tetrahydromethanopterin reductase-like flavin-dependent oxidoreductase (luciferase family)